MQRLVRGVSSRNPAVTKQQMHDWVARLEVACEAMRRRLLACAAINTSDMALLYVSTVPPKPVGPACNRAQIKEVHW